MCVWVLKDVPDDWQSAFEVLENVAFCEMNHRPPALSKEEVSPVGICGILNIMAGAVDLNNQLPGSASEVCDVWPDGFLAAEADAELAAAEFLPQLDFAPG